MVLSGDGAMDLVAKPFWIQLHADQLFNTTNKGEGFEFREIKIGIEIGGHFSCGGRRQQNRSQEHAEQEEKGPVAVLTCCPD
jgi:hypothetical protein